MLSRIELQTYLEKLSEEENIKVYFQPPPTIKLTYPCLIIEFSDIFQNFANNKLYSVFQTYEITHISTNPDAKFPSELVKNEGFSYIGKIYINDGLYHQKIKYNGTR